MQLTFSDEVRIQTVSANALPYGECCRLVNTIGLHTHSKADITAVYMKQRTLQREVTIWKQEGLYSRQMTTKLMNLETGEIICVPVGAEVIPVAAKVVVSEISGRR